MCISDCADRSGISVYFQMVYVQTFAGQCVENILDSNGGSALIFCGQFLLILSPTGGIHLACG